MCVPGCCWRGLHPFRPCPSDVIFTPLRSTLFSHIDLGLCCRFWDVKPGQMVSIIKHIDVNRWINSNTTDSRRSKTDHLMGGARQVHAAWYPIVQIKAPAWNTSARPRWLNKFLGNALNEINHWHSINYPRLILRTIFRASCWRCCLHSSLTYKDDG